MTRSRTAPQGGHQGIGVLEPVGAPADGHLGSLGHRRHRRRESLDVMKPRLLQTVIDAPDHRGLAEFHQELGP
jgi:hypothetical protein